MHQLRCHLPECGHPLLVSQGLLDSSETRGDRPEHPPHDPGVTQEILEGRNWHAYGLRRGDRRDGCRPWCLVEERDLTDHIPGTDPAQLDLFATTQLGHDQLAGHNDVHLLRVGAFLDYHDTFVEPDLLRCVTDAGQQIARQVGEVGEPPEYLGSCLQSEARCW